MRVTRRGIAAAIACIGAAWASVSLVNGADFPATPSWSTGLPAAVRVAASPLTLPPACRMSNLPEVFEYDAVGVYQGAETDLRPDARFGGLDFVGSVHVKVTATGRPVVLMLSAFRPTVWIIEAAAGVEIAGVATAGLGPALVQGDLPPAGKIIDLMAGQCGLRDMVYAYNGDDFRGLHSLAIAVAGARLSTFQGDYGEGTFIVGPGATHISELSEMRAKLQNLDKYLQPNDKVQPLIDQGAIRPATGDELFAWASLDPEITAYGLVRGPRMRRATYMILQPFAFPPGMHGPSSVNFILPKDRPMPTGDMGHNSILKMDVSDGCIEMLPGRKCRGM